RFGDDRAEAAGKQLAGRRRRPGGGLDAAFDLHSQEQAGGREQRTRGDEEDDTGVGNGDEDAGDERAEEGTEALERRGRAVGGDQLLRRPRERRQRRLESRPEDRRGDADDACEGEDNQLAAAEEEGRRGAAERGRAGECDPDEKTFAPEAVPKRRGK